MGNSLGQLSRIIHRSTWYDSRELEFDHNLLKNHESDWETKLIFGFSLKNRNLYSNIIIILDDQNGIWWVGRLISIKLMVIYSITTNATLMLLSILPENQKSNGEIDLIFGFSIEFWIIDSLPRILSDNRDGELI